MKRRAAMRTARKRALAIVGVTALALTVLPIHAMAGTIWQTTQLTNNTCKDVDAHISGDRLAWVAYDGPFDPALGGPGSEVYTQRIGEGSPTRLTNNACSDHSVQVDGDRVVWASGGGSAWDIYTWKAGDAVPTKLTPQPQAWAGQPQVSGDRVVWAAFDGSYTRKVYTWKSGDSGPTQLSASSLSSERPVVSGDRIAWDSWDGTAYSIYTWADGDIAPSLVAARATEPQLSGNRLAWVSYYEPGDSEVYTWQVGDASPTKVTDNDYEDRFVRLSGNRLVWEGGGTRYGYAPYWPHFAPESEIYTWTPTDAAPVQVTANSRDDGNPRISGDRLVWFSDLNFGSWTEHSEIMTWAFGDVGPTTLTCNAYDAYAPEVSGDTVVWQKTGFYDADWDVVMARRVEVPDVQYLEPINADGTSIFKAGSTVPVKVTLADASGYPVAGAAPSLKITYLSSWTGEGELEAVSTSAADTGSAMREQSPGMYMFNLSTKDYAPGSYRLDLVTGDGVISSVSFAVK